MAMARHGRTSAGYYARPAGGGATSDPGRRDGWSTHNSIAPQLLYPPGPNEKRVRGRAWNEVEGPSRRRAVGDRPTPNGRPDRGREGRGARLGERRDVEGEPPRGSSRARTSQEVPVPGEPRAGEPVTEAQTFEAREA